MAKRSNIVGLNIWNLLVKQNFWPFGHVHKTSLVLYCASCLRQAKNVFELFQKHHATNFAYFCLSNNVWSFGRLSNIACQKFNLLLSCFNNLQHFGTQQLLSTTRRSCLRISKGFVVPKCWKKNVLGVAKRSNICCKANLKCWTNNVWLLGEGLLRLIFLILQLQSQNLK